MKFHHDIRKSIVSEPVQRGQHETWLEERFGIRIEPIQADLPSLTRFLPGAGF